MATTEIILSLAKLFIMIVPGFILARAHVLNEEQSKGISTIIINLTWPCLIIISLQREFSIQLCINMGYVAAAIILVIIIAYLITKLVCRLMKIARDRTYLITFMVMFGNTAWIGIPVCKALYGADGTFYAALLDAIQDMFIFTVGLVMIEKSTGRHIGLSLKHFLTPGVISIVIGLILFVAGISLPDIIYTPMNALGSATSPLAMTVIGYQLGCLNLKELFKGRDVYVMMLLKLIVIPLIFLAAVKIIMPDPDVMMKTLIVEMATPAAACTAIYAQQYGGDAAFATRGVMLSTVFSIVTLSLFAIAAEMI